MIKRKKTDVVQLKLRLVEDLRKRLEIAAESKKRSLNSEIIARLENSFDQTSSVSRLEKIIEKFHESVMLMRAEREQSVLDDLALALAPRPDTETSASDDPRIMMFRLREELGRAPTREEINAAMQKATGLRRPLPEEPELPMQAPRRLSK